MRPLRPQIYTLLQQIGGTIKLIPLVVNPAKSGIYAPESGERTCPPRISRTASL